MKTIYDNDEMPPVSEKVQEILNAAYYAERHRRNTECATIAWALAGFALFCMIIGAVVMKIAMGG